MEFKDLIPLSDYVLEQEKEMLKDKSLGMHFANITNYATFLKQPLKLSMFIPCDENEKPLGDPELTLSQGDGFTYYGAEDEEFEQYQKALDNVIFEGFSYKQETDHVSTLGINDDLITYYPIPQSFYDFGVYKVFKTIEDLTHLNIKAKY